MTRWQFSSSGWRNQSNPWFRIGSLEVTTTILIVLIGVVTMFMWAANPSTFEPFYYDTALVKNGEIWRLVTWPLINAPTLSAAIMLALFYFFGRDVEAMLGRNRFLVFLGLIVVIPSIITFLLSYLGTGRFEAGAAGLRLVELGVFTVYVAERPFARTFFGIPLWGMLAVVVGIDVLQLLGWRAFLPLILELLILALSIVLVRGWGFADEVAFVPRLPIPGSANATKRYKAAKAPKGRRAPGGGSSSGGVVTGPWPTSPPTSGPLTPPPPFNYQRELDALLDKVASGGLGSLSATERKRLEDLSKQSRDQR